MESIENIVLVHGAWADGSGWEGVYKLLRQHGHSVTVVQNPTLSLAGDAAAVRSALETLDGPVILVGHSYGGAVISEAGTHPKVAGLVYIAAWVPEKGESVGALAAQLPPGGPPLPILPPQNGYLLLDRARFPEAFAADVSPEKAAFMADSQVPWGLDAASGTVSEPAWKSRPSWYLVATSDRMIPPASQRSMAKRAGARVVEAPGSHAVFVSNPAVVAALIERAAEEAVTASAGTPGLGAEQLGSSAPM